MSTEPQLNSSDGRSMLPVDLSDCAGLAVTSREDGIPGDMGFEAAVHFAAGLVVAIGLERPDVFLIFNHQGDKVVQPKNLRVRFGPEDGRREFNLPRHLFRRPLKHIDWAAEITDWASMSRPVNETS